jgi:tetratricopeptide (TPR) repeat protein
VRRILPLLLPLLVGADLVKGQRLLIAGRYADAAREFRTITEETPSEGAAWVGLGRARAGLGLCDRAIESFADWRHTGAYNARAAIAEGWCSYRLGWNGNAIESAQDALRLKPNLGSAQYLLAMAAAADGDDVTFDEAVEGLLTTERGPAMIALAEGWRAVEQGDAFGVDMAVMDLIELEREFPKAGLGAQRALIDAQRWLDLGDPQSAYQALRSVRGGGAEYQIRVSVLQAEAMRRLGEPGGAHDLLEERELRSRTGTLPRAVRLRILTDLGRFDEVSLMLPGLLVMAQPDDVATVWYFAKKTGDTALEARAAALWDTLVDHPDRTLDQLIPVVGP